MLRINGSNSRHQNNHDRLRLHHVVHSRSFNTSSSSSWTTREEASWPHSRNLWWSLWWHISLLKRKHESPIPGGSLHPRMGVQLLIKVLHLHLRIPRVLCQTKTHDVKKAFEEYARVLSARDPSLSGVQPSGPNGFVSWLLATTFGENPLWAACLLVMRASMACGSIMSLWW